MEMIQLKIFEKMKKLEYKKNKLKLDIDFLNNCKQLSVYSKFLIFKLPNVSNKYASSIRKRLFRSDINKRNKELQHLSKELSLSENVLSTKLSTIDFYIHSMIKTHRLENFVIFIQTILSFVLSRKTINVLLWHWHRVMTFAILFNWNERYFNPHRHKIGHQRPKHHF